MPHRIPSLRLHATGQWFVRYGGRNHYLGTDRRRAEERYAEHLRTRAVLQQISTHMAVPPADLRPRTLAEAAEVYIAEQYARASRSIAAKRRCMLSHLVHAMPGMPVEHLQAAHASALIDDMRSAGYKPNTLRTAAATYRHMMRWYARRYASVRLAWNGDAMERVSVPRLPRRYQPPEYVARFALVLEALRPELGAAIRLQYLACLRPIECDRLIAGAPVWHRPERGKIVLALPNKTVALSGEPHRFVALSDEAREAYERARSLRPEPLTYQTYASLTRMAWDLTAPEGQIVRDLLAVGTDAEGRPAPPPGWPRHFLRHSAYQALLDADVDLTRARMLAGHVVPGAWNHYADAPWHRWQSDMATLTLRTHEASLLADGSFADSIQRLRAANFPRRRRLKLANPPAPNPQIPSTPAPAVVAATRARGPYR